ncbi:type II/IV secretion system ATPase subunit [Methanogenium organophilum]|nr:ATPase, T2SS/T4P/T4SS family [Methanogenium organophilum]
MKEKKSFFGGLRRGNKQKETGDAVSIEEKTEENVYAEQETSQIIADKITIPETEKSSDESDEKIISEHTRPNETFANLLSDIRKTEHGVAETDENVATATPQDNDVISPGNESGDGDVTLKDIIAGIRKTNSENISVSHEPEPEDKINSDSSFLKEENEISSGITNGEEIPKATEEDNANATIGQIVEEFTAEKTADEPQKTESIGEISEHSVTRDDETSAKTPSHLDSLIADVQQNTMPSPVQEPYEEPDSEHGEKIDGIIRELLSNNRETPKENFFNEDTGSTQTATLSSMIHEIQNSEDEETENTSQENPDDLINELVQRYDDAEQVPDISNSQNSSTRITRIIEEISSEGVKNIRKEKIEITPDTVNSHQEKVERKRRRNDGIISAEEAANFSDLILSGGAELDLEDFHISDSSRIFEMSNRTDIISALDEIVEGDLESLDLSKMRPAESLSEEGPEQVDQKKKFGQGIFGKIRGKVVQYDPAIHGSLINLAHDSADGIEEIELYPVNEPYAYIRIIFDHNSHEYLYTVIEPELSEGEKILVQELTQRLFETLDINTKDLTKERARSALTEAVDNIIFDYAIKLDPVSREKILYHIHKNFIGDGLIDAIMHDKYIEDISCDGVNAPIFVFHSNYESIQTNLSYTRPDDLDSFVTKLAQRAGKYISIAEPMLDATMADGSRIQMTLGHEVTAHGSTFTIRKFKDEPITPTDLIEWGTYSPLSIAFLWLAVENGKSCIFAGGTASGKTTSLNAISLFIPPLAKIVTLEDTRELKLPHKNWIPSITRESFDSGGKGSIDMYELLRAALRQRPEYILVGEVRGKEAQTLFQAMSTGHVTYATTHADSVASVVHRFENPPMDVPRNMLSALDLVSVQVQARFGGQRIRRNKTLIEILDIDPRTNELITNEVFKWNAASDEIRFSGKSYILEDIMELKGWSDSRMREELKRRQEILEWMRIKKIRHFQEVGKVLLSYYRDPETVMELVRSDLYE